MSILFPTRRLVTDRRYYESGVRGRFEPNLRIERGNIDTTGPTVLSGVGFTLTKNGAGDITVTFDPPFSAAPSPNAITRDDGTAGIFLAIIGSPTTSTVRFGRIHRTLGLTDGEIYFIVIGPS